MNTLNTQVLSDDPVKAIKEMIAIVGTLNEVYTQENEALKAFDMNSFIALKDTKINIAQNYAAGIEDIQNRAEQMKKTPKRLRNKLRDMQQRFAALSQENLEVLDSTKRVADRLGDTIHKAARESVKKQQTHRYGDNGRFYKPHKQGLSMGINESA